MRNPSSARSVFGRVMVHELRLLAANRSLWIVAALFIALVAYGLLSGLTRIGSQDTALSIILNEQEARMKDLVKQMKAIYAGTEKPDLYLRPDSPSWVGGALGARHAVMPTTPLAPLALGQSDLFPDNFKVSSYDKTTFIFNDPLQNPWHLATGHFDLAFVMVYLMPLLVIALSYNSLSAEREDGTLKLLLAEPLSLGTLVVGKIMARVVVLMALALVFPLVALPFLRPQISGAAYVDLLLWAVIVVSYASFWFALAIWVNSWGKSSAANGVILCSIWATLVFIAPVLLNVAVSKLHPVPSRVEMMTQVRALVAEARKRYGEMNTEDYHPELVPVEKGKVYIQGYQKVSWRIQRDLKPQTDAMLDRFDRQLAQQQDLVDRYRFLSPAIVTYEAMTDLAGTGIRRYRHFMRQVNAFHDQNQEFFFPRVFAELRMTEEDYKLLPGFQWQEELHSSVLSRAAMGVIGLWAPTTVVLGLGIRRLRFYPKT
jgi:ABC-2 type transport system permease protein